VDGLCVITSQNACNKILSLLKGLVEAKVVSSDIIDLATAAVFSADSAFLGKFLDFNGILYDKN
jgi:hypothetical protein